jgi:hypothetical protein
MSCATYYIYKHTYYIPNGNFPITACSISYNFPQCDCRLFFNTLWSLLSILINSYANYQANKPKNIKFARHFPIRTKCKLFESSDRLPNGYVKSLFWQVRIRIGEVIDILMYAFLHRARIRRACAVVFLF